MTKYIINTNNEKSSMLTISERDSRGFLSPKIYVNFPSPPPQDNATKIAMAVTAGQDKEDIPKGILSLVKEFKNEQSRAELLKNSGTLFARTFVEALNDNSQENPSTPPENNTYSFQLTPRDSFHVKSRTAYEYEHLDLDYDRLKKQSFLDLDVSLHIGQNAITIANIYMPIDEFDEDKAKALVSRVITLHNDNAAEYTDQLLGRFTGDNNNGTLPPKPSGGGGGGG